MFLLPVSRLSNRDSTIENKYVGIGFELLTHSCAPLAFSYAGHSHFERYSTLKSPELIIRNIARNRVGNNSKWEYYTCPRCYRFFVV